jgi:hypothetical protein
MKEQGSIGFQPVSRDHCVWSWEIGNDVGVSQSRRSIGAGYRLEAYATLLAVPDRYRINHQVNGIGASPIEP